MAIMPSICLAQITCGNVIAIHLASNEYRDTQIEQTEKYYDAMIQGMEEYRSRWEELSDLQEHAEMIALLEELGYIEEDLADAGSGAFDRLRTSYLGILKDMNDGNQGVLDGLNNVCNGFSNVADSASNAASDKESSDSLNNNILHIQNDPTTYKIAESFFMCKKLNTL